jgi:hypothetical protein
MASKCELDDENFKELICSIEKFINLNELKLDIRYEKNMIFI